jgi:hypothetical protein
MNKNIENYILKELKNKEIVILYKNDLFIN